MNEIYRILDANFNRARESLRAIEDSGRFVLNDPAITAMAKTFRSDIRELLEDLPTKDMVCVRNAGGDVGTVLSSPTENKRCDCEEVATAACKRLTEALRTLEEYSKVIAPQHTSTLERMRYNAYTLEQQVTNRFMVGKRFSKVRLYSLISARLCQSTGVMPVARQAIAGGSEAIQLREKDTPDDIYLAMAAELRELTDETNRLLLINDRVDIALELNADGVHVGASDEKYSKVVSRVPDDMIVGVSARTVKNAQTAMRAGVTYLGTGAVFPTPTKPDAPVIGIDGLKNVVEAVSIPVTAIGGISTGNVKQVMRAGARYCAVISQINDAKDITAGTAEFVEMLRNT